MPYVQRDTGGKIIAIAKQSSESSREFLSPTHPDIISFLAADQNESLALDILQDSDREIARVTEDLIYLLISKNIILFTELPEPVQQKLLAREKLRASVSGTIDNFLDESELL